MTDPWIIVIATAALIVASAFFVVIEFALLGARRHRLEEQAESSRAARAALRGMNELTIMLAVAQFGITACTFALGAVTKPAVDALLTPALEAIGLPLGIADVSSFVLSLLVVTFLHLVVGEMAPKSWAIAHPEVAAKIIGIPGRALARALRPLLVWVNAMANRLVAASGVEPVDRAAVGGRDADTIRHLVELSARSGTLDRAIHGPMTRALSFESLVLEDIISGRRPPTGVAAGSTVGDVHAAVRRSGHLRVLLETEDRAAPAVVHVRDTLLADPEAPAADFAHDGPIFATDVRLRDALTTMQREGRQLAVVMDGERLAGVVTVNDLLEHILPRVNGTAGS